MLEKMMRLFMICYVLLLFVCVFLVGCVVVLLFGLVVSVVMFVVGIGKFEVFDV